MLAFNLIPWALFLEAALPALLVREPFTLSTRGAGVFEALFPMW
jgi:hypothetical protein